jgi:hypothetical protein
MDEHIAREGCLTKREPTESEWADIEFGFRLAKEMARLQVGQTIVVKEQAVIAVEAIEGSDEAIKRGGKLGRGNIVVVKVSKPDQDLRFDVPTVGTNTIKTLHEARASVLALEADLVLMLDKPADRWLDAFPIGNGKLGAMVFGGVLVVFSFVVLTDRVAALGGLLIKCQAIIPTSQTNSPNSRKHHSQPYRTIIKVSIGGSTICATPKPLMTMPLATAALLPNHRVTVATTGIKALVSPTPISTLRERYNSQILVVREAKT